MRNNDLKFLLHTYKRIKKAKLPIWLFGGWAEELLNIIYPRGHGDIDFLYKGDNFSLLEKWVDLQSDIIEIADKKFVHKRAYEVKGIKLEFILADNYKTNFLGMYKFKWPEDTFSIKATRNNRIINIASPKALYEYRQSYKKLNYSKAQADWLLNEVSLKER